MARLRFADRFPSSGRRTLSVNRFLRGRFCTGLEGPDKANYQHPGWAKLDDRSGPSRTIKLKPDARLSGQCLLSYRSRRFLLKSLNHSPPLPQRREGGPQLLNEQVGLFKGSKVPTPIQLIPVDQV